MRPSTSIFSKEFKRLFNQNKYQNLVALRNDSYTHMSFISPLGFKVSRALIYFGVTGAAFFIYLTPDYFHELVGHLRQPPKKVVGLTKGLTAQEAEHNLLLIHRKEEEHHLEHFVEAIKQT